jgi:predicted DNA binding CopG/RHH family protein
MSTKKIKIDLTKLEPIDELTAEEQEFHQLMMSDEAVFHSDAKTINKYAEIFKNNAKQRKAISLRIPKQDYFAIKAKALQLGLPYQALINLIIHRYVTTEAKEKLG